MPLLHPALMNKQTRHLNAKILQYIYNMLIFSLKFESFEKGFECELKDDLTWLWAYVPGKNGKTTKEHVSQSSMAYKKTTYKSKFNLCLKHIAVINIEVLVKENINCL